MTKLQRMNLERPRTWAAISFIPFVFGTVVLFPICCIYCIVIETPRIAKNLWCDIRSGIGEGFKDGFRTLSDMWIVWWDAVKGNESLKEAKKLISEEKEV